MVIVSGSSGFVGQNLLNRIPEAVGVSLRDKNWPEKFKDSSIIINLVGKAHDHLGIATKEDYYMVNFDLTKSIFEEFVRSKSKLFIHISSIAATEEIESVEPLVEEGVCNPVSWYGKSKRDAEEWLLNQEMPEGKKMIILRPPMIHGPGDKGNLGLLYKFISKGLPYPFSNFNNSRSFISITNFIFYIKEVIAKYEDMENGIYHVADNEFISTTDIIEIIKGVTGKNVLKLGLPKSIVRLIANMGEVLPIPLNKTKLKKLTSTLVVSNKKINRSLNITKLPETSSEGVIRTINWFRNNNH